MAEALASAAGRGEPLRIAGGRTRSDWGGVAAAAAAELETSALDAIVEHNEGDLTAVLQAGVPVAAAQAAFAGAGQMLALDAPLGSGEAGTIGGLVATGDSGPLRHRHGAVRDLILGIAVALPDGTVARAGGRVIKNVAGYDLAKLHCGALGTLGVVVEAVFRLHPRPSATRTVIARVRDPDALAAAAAALARAPLELLALDARWGAGEGALLARAGGAAADELTAAAGRVLAEAGLAAELVEDDEELWSAQREGQRATEGGCVVRVSGLPAQLAETARTADALEGALVGRAGLGLTWISFDAGADAAAAVSECRARLAPSPCVVVEAPAEVRAALDPWGVADGPELTLMRRLKERFDPARVCNPGLQVGGI